MLKHQLVYKRKEKIREGKNIWHREWKKLRNKRAQSDSDTREKDSCRNKVQWSTGRRLFFSHQSLTRPHEGWDGMILLLQQDHASVDRFNSIWNIFNSQQPCWLDRKYLAYVNHERSFWLQRKVPSGTRNTFHWNYKYPNTEQIHASSMLSPDTS